MIWLMAFLGVFICLISILSANEDRHDKSLTTFSRIVLRFFASCLFILGLLVAFKNIDLLDTKFYGFVKIEHNLLSAIVLELAAVVLALLSLNIKRCSKHF